MKPRVLFIVTGDPRSSTRPAEAVRIAAGVSAWQKADITVYLAESGQPIYVQKNASSLAKLGEAAVPFTEISDDQLAQLAAEQTYVMRF